MVRLNLRRIAVPAVLLALIGLIAFAGPAAAQRRRPPVTPPPTRIPPVVAPVSTAAKPVTFELDVPGKGRFACTFDAAKNGKQWGQFASGTSKIAGVHLYTQSYRTGVNRCDVWFSNGTVNPDGSGFCGEIYFDSISIRGPPGTEIVAYLRKGESVAGNVYSVVKPLPGTDKHVFLAREQFGRSFCLVPIGARSAGLAVLDREGFRIEDKVTNFGPLNATLPKIDRAATDALMKTRVDKLRAALLSGTPVYDADYLLTQGAIDFLHPDGELGGDNPGGFGIELLPGDRQTRWGLVLTEELCRLNVEGRRTAAFNAATGDPIRSREWASTPNRQNIVLNRWESPDRWESIRELPQFISGAHDAYVYPVFNSGHSASHRAVKLKIRQYDVQHCVREARHLLVAHAFTAEPFYRDRFAMMHENLTTDGWSNRTDEHLAGPGDGWQHPNLKEKLRYVEQNSHRGGWFERGFGWQMWNLAYMLRLYPERQDLREDAAVMIKIAVLAADKFGITVCAWGNEAPHYFPLPQIKGLQTFHAWLVDNGLYALCMQLHGKITPEVLDVLERSFATITGLPIRFMGNDVYSPPKWVELERDGIHATSLDGRFKSEEGDPCPGYPHHLGALLYSATGNMEYLSTPLHYWHPHTTLVERRTWLAQQEAQNWGGLMLTALQSLSTNAVTRTRPTWD